MKKQFIKTFEKFIVSKDWDELYDEAQTEPIKSEIIKELVKVYKDKEVLIRVGDNFEWSDGSNGYINFDNFNHYLTDIGYRLYADLDGDLDKFKDPVELKKEILYAYASSDNGDFKRGQKYADFKYNPKDEFHW
jgi:hypothetical protein